MTNHGAHPLLLTNLDADPSYISLSECMRSQKKAPQLLPLQPKQHPTSVPVRASPRRLNPFIDFRHGASSLTTTTSHPACTAHPTRAAADFSNRPIPSSDDPHSWLRIPPRVSAPRNPILSARDRDSH